MSFLEVEYMQIFNYDVVFWNIRDWYFQGLDFLLGGVYGWCVVLCMLGWFTLTQYLYKIWWLYDGRSSDVGQRPPLSLEARCQSGLQLTIGSATGDRLALPNITAEYKIGKY